MDKTQKKYVLGTGLNINRNKEKCKITKTLFFFVKKLY